MGLSMHHQEPSALTTRVDPRALQLIAYWYANVGDTGVPTRATFDALCLRPWLGYISIYRLIEPENEFLNVLEGSCITEMTGDNWTGRLASDVDRKFNKSFHNDLAEVQQSGTPKMESVEIFQRNYKTATRLLLPIATINSGLPDQIFLSLIPEKFLYTDNISVRSHLE